MKNNTATLRETMVERYYPSKKGYRWVKAYFVTTPDGKELHPPFPAVTSHYEISAREFCLQSGWKVIYIK